MIELANTAKKNTSNKYIFNPDILTLLKTNFKKLEGKNDNQYKSEVMRVLEEITFIEVNEIEINDKENLPVESKPFGTKIEMVKPDLKNIEIQTIIAY